MPRSHGQFAIIPARSLDDTRLDETDLRALLILGTYADRDGWCHPKLRTIAERLNISKPTASKRMSRLEKFGYTLIVHNTTEEGDPDVNQYRIIHDAELPKEFDRTLIKPEKRVFPEHTGDGNTVFPEHTDTGNGVFPEHTGEVNIERPIGTSQLNGESGAKSAPPADKESPKLPDSPPVVKAKEEIRAILEGQNCGANPALADATVDKREYRERVGAAFAAVLRHVDARGSPDPSQNDKSAAGKLFDLHFPVVRALQFLEYAANGGGERYRTGTTKDGKALTAYHVVNDMDDWRKSGYPAFYSRDDVTQAALSMLPNLGAG